MVGGIIATLLGLKGRGRKYWNSKSRQEKLLGVQQGYEIGPFKTYCVTSEGRNCWVEGQKIPINSIENLLKITSTTTNP